MRIAGVVAVGRGARDDAGMGIDAEAGRQGGRVGQGVAGGRGGEVAGDVEREGLALISALVRDGGGGRSAVADRQMEALADRLAMGVGRRDRDRVVAEVAVGRRARDHAGVGIDAEAGRQLGRKGQGIAGSGGGEMAGDIEREALALVGALVCDGGGGRAAVADRQMEALADRLAMGVGRGDRDRVVAEVAVGRRARDDAGMGVDAEAGRQLGREGQGIAGSGSGEVAGDIEREALTLIGALVCDGGGGRAAVADREMEALADRLAMGIGRRHRDRVVAEVAVGRRAGDDAGMGVDAEAGRQRGREGQRIAGSRGGEVAGDIEREGLGLHRRSGSRWRLRSGRCRRPARWKLSLIALPWASVAVTVIVLLPKSLSVGVPEMTPVWALMLRPAGSDAEKVSVSPAAGACEVA